MSRPSAKSTSRAHGDVLTAISDGMVALLKEFYGRGPTRAKSYYEDDLVVCLLRGGFTRVEQTLLAGGRGSSVIQQRMEFQELMREHFTAVIEEATGRRVISPSSRIVTTPSRTADAGTVTTSSAEPTTTSTAAVTPVGSDRLRRFRVTVTAYVVVPLAVSGSAPISVTRPASGCTVPAGITDAR